MPVKPLILATVLLCCTHAHAQTNTSAVKTFEQSRLTEIETTNAQQDKQIYGIRTMQPSAWNTPLEARLKTIEARMNEKVANQHGDNTTCQDLKVSGSKQNTLLCPSGQAVVGFTTENGKLTSARCCPLR